MEDEKPHKAPILSIRRDRTDDDGSAMSVHVDMHGCPLRCKFCHDSRCYRPAKDADMYTARQLYDMLSPDEPKILAGGGIVFGGGEPCLYADFIDEFRRICGPEWRITVETTLNVSFTLLRTLSRCVDHWIVDIKADDSAAFLGYTGSANNRARSMLFYITSVLNVSKDSITIHVPTIPGYVTDDDADTTADCYAALDFPSVHIVHYKEPEPDEDEDKGDVAAEPGASYDATSTVMLPPPILKCTIAGLNYHLEPDDELWDELYPYCRLALYHDITNKYDHNAVAIVTEGDFDPTDPSLTNHILGYIPRTMNSDIARRLDEGEVLFALIDDLKKTGPYNDRITVAVYSDGEYITPARPGLLRGHTVDVDAFDSMQNQLMNHGAAIFRWGGFAPGEYLLPVVGEKVAVFFRRHSDYIMYLMRVMATDIDCRQFFEDAPIDMDDGCRPFALTNIKGPLKAPRHVVETLLGTDPFVFRAENYLTPQVHTALTDLLDSLG